MALDRLVPISTTPGAVDGDAYMDLVQEEITGLWDRVAILLTSIAGTGNAITAVATPALTGGTLVNGMRFFWVAANLNVTGAVTLAIGGGTPTSVLDHQGVTPPAGTIKPGTLYESIIVSGAHRIVTPISGLGMTFTGGWEHISSVTPTAVASISFTGLAIRKSWRMTWSGITRSAAAAAHWVLDYNLGAGLVGAQRVSVSADWDTIGCEGSMEFHGARNGDRAVIKTFSMDDTAAGDQRIHHRQIDLGALTDDVEGFQLSASAGTFDAGGIIRLFAQ